MAESAVKAKKRNGKINKNIYGYVFTAPFIISFLVFSLYPLLYTFYLSMTNSTLMSKTSKFIAFDNFKTLFKDTYFTQSILNTWKIWLLNFLPQIGIAMLLAVWFTNNRLKIKNVGMWRVIYYLPNLLMPATIAVLFANLFALYGPANLLLVKNLKFLPKAFEFYRSEGWSQAIVIFVQWWMWFGSTLIVIMAGMTSISPTYYESASVDGASAWQQFTKITLPLLKPILVYTLVTSLVGGMQMFDIPYMITDQRGSPNGSLLTMNLSMYMKFSSSKGHIGLASAVGVVIFIITSIAAFIIVQVLKDRDSTSNEADLRRVRRRNVKKEVRA